jgi:transcriptional regulator with XRE-family HTH domain
MIIKITKKELRLRRASLSLNQACFATMLSVKSRAHYSRIEEGKRPISKSLQKSYFKIFGRRLLIDKIDASDARKKYNRRIQTVLRKGGTPNETIKQLLFLAWGNIHEHGLREQSKTKGGDTK